MEGQYTIKDVAKLAGVSVATASRVLGDSGYPVSPRLKQKVQEAAQSLGYVPNTVAKSLRQSGSKDIGVVVPNITNPFYMQAILGINQVLSDAGYNMILCNTLHDAERERICLQQLAQRQVSGVILSSVSNRADNVAEYHRRGVRLVMLDQKLGGVDCPSINFDSRAGTQMAVEHLIAQGHQKIAFASTPITRWTRSEMLKGYKDALSKAGIPFDEHLVYVYSKDEKQLYQDNEISAGRILGSRLIEDGLPVTAVMCVNDMLAIGLMQRLLKNGVRIPGDVSVIGFDDIPFAEAFVPALTTIRYPAAETGRLAALLLLDPIINNTGNAPLMMNLSPQLIERDTVKKK